MYIVMNRRLGWIAGVSLILIVSLGLWGGSKRPLLVPAISNSPDGSHVTKVFGSNVSGQRLNFSGDVAGILIALDTQQRFFGHEELILHVREAGSENDLRAIATTAEEATQRPEIRYNPLLLEELSEETTLFFPFEFVRSVSGKPLDFILEAPGLSSGNALSLAFQIDSTKFESGSLIVNGKERAGDLGFVLYERPTILSLVWRWMMNPKHRMVWVGIWLSVVSLVGAIISRKFPVNILPEPFWQTAWQDFSWRKAGGWMILLGALVLAIYWPATKLFHWQDDHFKLMRVEYLSEQPLKLWFTNHAFRDPLNLDKSPVVFYRPFSFSFLPWLIWIFVGTSAFWYHLFALLVLAAATVLIFLLSYLFLRSYSLSFLVALVWATHSTRVSAAYWWSTTEDSVAVFFMLMTVLFITRYLAEPKAWWRWGMVGAAMLALFSKEHALFLIVLLPFMDIVFHRYRGLKKFMLSRIYIYWPLWLVGGMYLIIHTVGVYDPTLPHFPVEDKTYGVSVSPVGLVRNLVVYSSWSAENWLWAGSDTLNRLLSPLETWYASFFEEVYGAPYYPGILLLGLYLILLISRWRIQTQRNLLIFLAGWWVLMLMPVLLVNTVWNSRWLTLSSWAAIMVVAVLLPMVWQKVPHFLWLRRGLLLLGLVIGISYAFWAARLPAHTMPYVRIANFTQVASERFQVVVSGRDKVGDVYVVGVPHDARGTITSNLFHLSSDVSFERILFVHDIPTVTVPDVVVDMRDVQAL